jgi:dipeptidyl aminopeptidase/acylaminoacyl peptidase
MMTTNVTERITLALALLILVGVFASCGKDQESLVGVDDTVDLPTDMFPHNIQNFDSYSADAEIKLYWVTGQHWDPMTPPPPDVATVRIFMSQSSPDDGFRLVLERDHDGVDSEILDGLKNGRLYYFRLATFDQDDSFIGVSHPLMTSPGTTGPVLATVPLDQAESPKYIKNLSWSPDGASIAVIMANEPKGRPNLYTMDLVDLNLTKLTDFYGNYRLMGVAWSPNGSRLAYSYTASRTIASIDYRIWVVDLATQEKRSLSSGRVDDDPTWLSENKIIFTKGNYGPPNIPELYSLDVTSKVETPITNDRIVKKYNPSVRPDTSLLVYTGHSDGVKLYLSTPSGADQRVLIGSPYWDAIHPSWSPDGNTVYFISDRSGHNEVWSINVDGSGLKQVSHGLEQGVEHYYGRASPDGERLAFLTSPRRGEYVLEFRVPN